MKKSETSMQRNPGIAKKVGSGGHNNGLSANGSKNTKTNMSHHQPPAKYRSRQINAPTKLKYPSFLDDDMFKHGDNITINLAKLKQYTVSCDDDTLLDRDKVPKMNILNMNYLNYSHITPAGKSQLDIRASLDELTPSDNISNKKNEPTISCSCSHKTHSSTSSSSSSDATTTTTTTAKTTKTAKTNTSTISKLSKKYKVYKKYNGFGKAVETDLGKLKYTNDADYSLFAESKKNKYSLFENRKKSKFQTIQYYFDNKSYEQYVDNKLYGVVNGRRDKLQQQQQQQQPQQPSEPISVKAVASAWENNFAATSHLPTRRPPAAKSCENLKPIVPPPVAPICRNALKQPNSRNAVAATANGRVRQLSENFASRVPVPSSSIKPTNSMTDVARINQLFAHHKPLPLGSRMKSSSMAALNDLAVKQATERDKYRVHKKSAGHFQSNIFHNCQNITTGGDVVGGKTTMIEINGGCGSNSDLKPIQSTLMQIKLDADNHNVNHHQGKISLFITNDNKSCGSPTCQLDRCPATDQQDMPKSPKITDTCSVQIVPPPPPPSDRNVKVKNHPHRKYDNKINVNHQIKNEQNSVKIFVTSSNESSISSAESVDYGYYDQSSQDEQQQLQQREREDREQIQLRKDFFKEQILRNYAKLGCDGAIFYNSSYAYEEEEECANNQCANDVGDDDDDDRTTGDGSSNCEHCNMVDFSECDSAIGKSFICVCGTNEVSKIEKKQNL
jgi:hypothetical protein